MTKPGSAEQPSAVPAPAPVAPATPPDDLAGVKTFHPLPDTPEMRDVLRAAVRYMGRAPAPAPETPRGEPADAEPCDGTTVLRRQGRRERVRCGFAADHLGDHLWEACDGTRDMVKWLSGRPVRAAPALPSTAPRLLDGSNEDLAIARADAVEAAAEPSAPAVPADAGPSDEALVDAFARALNRSVEESLRVALRAPRLPDKAVAAYVREANAAHEKVMERLREYREALGDLLDAPSCIDTMKKRAVLARARALSPSREGDGRKEGP